MTRSEAITTIIAMDAQIEQEWGTGDKDGSGRRELLDIFSALGIPESEVVAAEDECRKFYLGIQP